MKVHFTVATRRPDSSISNVIEIPMEDVVTMSDQEVIDYIQSLYDQWMNLQIVKEWRIFDHSDGRTFVKDHSSSKFRDQQDPTKDGTS